MKEMKCIRLSPICYNVIHCKYIKFSGHAINQMFKRRISKQDVRFVIDNGETIKEYTDDKPFPSKLILGFTNKRALHVVLANDLEQETCYVITAYFPDAGLWDKDFKSKKKRR